MRLFLINLFWFAAALFVFGPRYNVVGERFLFSDPGCWLKGRYTVEERILIVAVLSPVFAAASTATFAAAGWLAQDSRGRPMPTERKKNSN